MSQVFEATFWGFFSGGALVLGASVGYFAKVPSRAVAGVMAFGSGVLISDSRGDEEGEAIPSVRPCSKWCLTGARVPRAVRVISGAALIAALLCLPQSAQAQFASPATQPGWEWISGADAGPSRDFRTSSNLIQATFTTRKSAEDSLER
jgi:hypothetical protein